MPSDHPSHTDPLASLAHDAIRDRFDAGLREYGVPLSEAERTVTLADVEEEVVDALFYMQHVRQTLQGVYAMLVLQARDTTSEQDARVMNMAASVLRRLLGEVP